MADVDTVQNYGGENTYICIYLLILRMTHL